MSRVWLLSMITFPAALLLVGCERDKPLQQTAVQPKTSAGSDKSAKDHSHGAGPHDGTLADWGGGKYHVEFTVDHNKQEATVYILGGDEKTPAAIKVKEIQLNIKDPLMQVALKAAPQDGDAEGSASRFVGNHKSLGVVKEYEGTITGVIDDTPYTGNFKEEPHGHGGE